MFRHGVMFRHGIHQLWEVRVNLRVHKSVSRIGLIRSNYYTTSIFGSVGWGFGPDPTGAVADPGEA